MFQQLNNTKKSQKTHKNWVFFTVDIALKHFESFCRYTNSFNRAITCVLRYENHIFSAQATHSQFEMKIFILVFCGKKLTALSTKNGHSTNLQYFRQSRPVNHVIQKYNKTEKKANKKYSRPRQVQPIFEGFSLCGSPTTTGGSGLPVLGVVNIMYSL